MSSRTFWRLMPLALLWGGFLGLVAIEPRAEAQPEVKHARGRVAPKNLEHLKQLKKAVALPPPTNLTSFDARTLPGVIGAIKDQGQCGSCWDFSGTFVVETALNKASLGPIVLSEQYTLSCCRNGGCGGDDNTTVLMWAKSHGLPKDSDYGPYRASETSCKWTSAMPLTQITDWGFCDGGQGNGVTPVQLIKNAIVAYGCVGCAVAAGGGEWDRAGPGTTLVGTSHNIDHDVGLVGFDDAHDNGNGTKGAWIMRNSWGTGWGDKGYAWIKYGAYDIGTEAVFAFVNNPNPPPPVPPPTPPPGPIPPPVPPPAPVPNHNLCFAIVIAAAAISGAIVWLIRKPTPPAK